MSGTEEISNQPIVIDNGSGIIKAGLAGQEHPKVLFPSYVGRPKHKKVMASAIEGDFFVGKRAEELRGLLKIRYPMEHGVVKDWNDMESIWRHTYSELRCQPDEHPVLLTEPPLNPSKNRENAAEIFFETFRVPALFISVQAVLSLYASGKTTGIVLDSGDGVTHAVPIFQGFTIPNSIMRVDLAGRDVTHQLQLLLRKGGYNFTTSAERETVKSIKESACYVAFDIDKEEEQLEAAKTSAKNAQYKYKLPDGNTINLGSERFRAPEILFRPDLVGDESAGIHELLVGAIQKSDLDLRSTLYSNIVLSGGSTLFSGFGDRLLKEVKSLAPKDTKIKISAPPERKYSVWMGASIVASLTTFKKMWLSYATYEEEGASAVHRQFF